MTQPPRIFGIVNITADSFSDGGKYLAAGTAISHARKLFADGADILDLGAAASNPDAQPVAPADEIKRLTPLVEAMEDRTRLSIDTFAAETQRWALAKGVGWLNDIRGFPEASIYGELAASNARLIVMHNVAARGRAERTATDPNTIFELLFRFFDDRLSALEAAGIHRRRLVVDPGMGFFLGANPEVSLAVLRGIGRLKSRYNLPVLISVSRKSFLRNLANADAAGAGSATLAAELFAASHGVDFIRTHDVTALKQALTVWQHLQT